jgi:hypothetical protein
MAPTTATKKSAPASKKPADHPTFLAMIQVSASFSFRTPFRVVLALHVALLRLSFFLVWPGSRIGTGQARQCMHTGRVDLVTASPSGQVTWVDSTGAIRHAVSA